MVGRVLSNKEIDIRQTLVDVLARVLPTLSEKEARDVKYTIYRMRKDIEESDKRSRRYVSRKADQKRELYQDCISPQMPSGLGQDQLERILKSEIFLQKDDRCRHCHR